MYTSIASKKEYTIYKDIKKDSRISYILVLCVMLGRQCKPELTIKK